MYSHCFPQKAPKLDQESMKVEIFQKINSLQHESKQVEVLSGHLFRLFFFSFCTSPILKFHRFIYIQNSPWLAFIKTFGQFLCN